MFGVQNMAPKCMAPKMVIKSNYILQKIFINFYKTHVKTVLTKNSKIDEKNAKNFNILGSKTPKNDLSTLKYGLPTSFTTLSSRKTTKSGEGPLMRLDASRALHVYPVLNAQSHEKRFENILLKDRARIQSNSLIVKNWQCPQK